MHVLTVDSEGRLNSCLEYVYCIITDICLGYILTLSGFRVMLDDRGFWMAYGEKWTTLEFIL